MLRRAHEPFAKRDAGRGCGRWVCWGRNRTECGSESKEKRERDGLHGCWFSCKVRGLFVCREVRSDDCEGKGGMSFEGLLSRVNEWSEREDDTQQTAGNRSLLIPFPSSNVWSSRLTKQHSSQLTQPRIVNLSFRMLPEGFDQTLSTATAAIYGALSSYPPHRVQFPQKSKGHVWLISASTIG